MDLIISQVFKKIKDPYIRDLIDFFTEQVTDNELRNFFLKSFLVYPHYNQVRKEAFTSAHLSGFSHHKLKNSALEVFIEEKLKEAESDIKKEARESFRIFSAKLKYSKFKNLLHSPEFEEMERYVNEECKERP